MSVFNGYERGDTVVAIDNSLVPDASGTLAAGSISVLISAFRSQVCGCGLACVVAVELAFVLCVQYANTVTPVLNYNTGTGVVSTTNLPKAPYLLMNLDVTCQSAVTTVTLPSAAAYAKASIVRGPCRSRVVTCASAVL